MAEDTSIQFKARLTGVETPEPWALILISFTQGLIEMSHTGQVVVS